MLSAIWFGHAQRVFALREDLRLKSRAADAQGVNDLAVIFGHHLNRRVGGAFHLELWQERGFIPAVVVQHADSDRPAGAFRGGCCRVGEVGPALEGSGTQTNQPRAERTAMKQCRNLRRRQRRHLSPLSSANTTSAGSPRPWPAMSGARGSGHSMP